MNLLHNVKTYPWVIPSVIAAFFIIAGALLHPLWGDEAETAFFAKTTLMYGIPKGWDGVNMSSLNQGILLNSDLVNHADPWSSIYLAALSFLILPDNSFTARLPFILIGILVVPLLYFLSLKVTQNKTIAFLTVAITSLCIPFLLYLFRVRYYVLTVFAGLMLFYLSLRLLEEKKVWLKISFILFGVLYIYSNYPSFVLFYISLFFSLVAYVKFSGKSIFKLKRFFIEYIGYGIIIGLSLLPWILFLKPSSGRVGFAPLAPETFISVVWFWLVGIYEHFNNSNTFPFLFIFILAVILYFEIKKRSKDLGVLIALLLIPITYFAGVTFISTLTVVRDTALTEIRYNVILMPIFIMILAFIFYKILKWNKVIFGVLLILYLTTNLFTLRPLRFYLFEYLGEIINPYPVSDELVAKHLAANARENETIFVNYDRSVEPLLFLLDDKRLRFVNRISPLNHVFFPKNFSILPKYVYNFRDDPDWVIKYSTHRFNYRSAYDFDIKEFDPVGRTTALDLKNNYDLTVLPVYYVSDISRSEIDRHVFTKIEPKYDEQVFVYHKKKANN